MSADNTILILKTVGGDRRPEFRVAHVQNAEMASLDMDPDARDEYLRHYFDGSTVHREESKALQEATRLLRRVGYVEYGIGMVSTGLKYPGLNQSSIPAGSGAKASNKEGERRRPSRLMRRIGTLTRRVKILEAEKHAAYVSLAEMQAQKAAVVAEIERVLAQLK